MEVKEFHDDCSMVEVCIVCILDFHLAEDSAIIVSNMSCKESSSVSEGTSACDFRRLAVGSRRSVRFGLWVLHDVMLEVPTVQEPLVSPVLLRRNIGLGRGRRRFERIVVMVSCWRKVCDLRGGDVESVDFSLLVREK